MNIFPGGIEKSANIGRNKKGQALCGQNWVKTWKFKLKNGYFFHQKAISEGNFDFFSKNRVHS